MKKISSLFYIYFIACMQLTAQTKDSIQIVARTDVFFDFAKWDIKSPHWNQLQSLTDLLLKDAELKISITAHTDAVGTDANNYALSEKRAKAVLDFMELYAKDSLKNRLEYKHRVSQIKAQGEQNPLYDNQTEAGRQGNRRATVELYKKISFTAQNPPANEVIYSPKSLVEGTVVEPKTQTPIANVKILFKQDKFRDSTFTDAKGHFSKELPNDSTHYQVSAYSNDHIFNFQNITVKKGQKTPPLTMRLPKKEIAANMVVKNLYFVGNKAILLPRSVPSLDALVEYMRFDKNVHIEIGGHINYPSQPNVERTSWHFVLSEDRAKAVFNYLLENGIEEKRLSWKGYGNSKMVFPFASTEEEQEANRRVEIKVVR